MVVAYDDCMSALATRSSALYVARITGASYTMVPLGGMVVPTIRNYERRASKTEEAKDLIYIKLWSRSRRTQIVIRCREICAARKRVTPRKR